jgi:signal transduction histidine kinase
MKLNIRAKVFFAVGLALVLIFSLVMYMLVTESTNQLRSDLNRESKSFASLATTPIGNTFILYQYSGTTLISQQINNYLGLDSDVSSVRVVSLSGKVLYTNQTGMPANISAARASSFQPVYGVNSNGYIDQVIDPLVETGGVHRYAVVYQISTKRVEQNVTNVIRLILVIGLAVLIVAITATNLMLNRLFIQPIRRLSKSADVISSGKYDEQILSNHKDEIGVLANSLNKMAGSLKADIVKLQDLDKLKSEFMMIASHNLRTPLTVIQGYIEMAQDAKSVDEMKTIIDTVSGSVSQLHLLAEDVLTISTLEAGSVMPRSLTSLKPFLDSIGNEFGLLAQKKSLVWNFKNTIPAHVQLNLAQTNIRSALASIIDNAIKFTKAGGSISIDTYLEGEELVFQVSDTGIGIKPEELPKLFTKFHRGTDTLQYDYEGVGIGLYLSKLIVNQHGGQIKIKSKLHEGTVCTVTLPLNSKPLA